MACLITMPALNHLSTNISNLERRNLCASSRRYRGLRAMMTEKPLEESYHVRVERNMTKDRLMELGLPWDWHVDQLVYIEEGEVRVVPEGSKRLMRFVAGDLVQYPKWFEADLYFNDFYQERYSFRAYGDN
ncbi:unnamed protein product [Withania somnifera]